jgi:hypothetical protein
MAKKLARLIRLDVVPWRGRWKVKRGATRIGMDRTQHGAISWAQAVAWRLLVADARGVTIRIHRPDGRVREERTYPRSADPKRSKG